MVSGARDEREERILAVAADLLVRHGYRRTTVDEVAARAGVGKGTVYLHWSSRDELFRAAIGREMAATIGDLAETVRSDPGAWRPHRIAHRYALAVLGRPLLAAVILADQDVLGGLALPADDPRIATHQPAVTAYFAALGRHGALREGWEPTEAAFAFAATLEGFLRAVGPSALATGPASPPAAVRGRVAELLATVVRHAFEPPRHPDAVLAVVPAQDREARIRADVLASLSALAHPTPTSPRDHAIRDDHAIRERGHGPGVDLPT